MAPNNALKEAVTPIKGKSLLQELLQRYSSEELKAYFLELASLAQRLNEAIDQVEQYLEKINDKKVSIPDKKLDLAFELIQNATTISRDYYQKLAKFPEDIRTFLSTTTVDNPEQVEQLFQPAPPDKLFQRTDPAPWEQLWKRLLLHYR